MLTKHHLKYKVLSYSSKQRFLDFGERSFSWLTWIITFPLIVLKLNAVGDEFDGFWKVNGALRVTTEDGAGSIFTLKSCCRNSSILMSSRRNSPIIMSSRSFKTVSFSLFVSVVWEWEGSTGNLFDSILEMSCCWSVDMFEYEFNDWNIFVTSELNDVGWWNVRMDQCLNRCLPSAVVCFLRLQVCGSCHVLGNISNQILAQRNSMEPNIRLDLSLVVNRIEIRAHNNQLVFFEYILCRLPQDSYSFLNTKKHTLWVNKLNDIQFFEKTVPIFIIVASDKSLLTWTSLGQRLINKIHNTFHYFWNLITPLHCSMKIKF